MPYLAKQNNTVRTRFIRDIFGRLFPGKQPKNIIFSGDLGAPYFPILKAPKSPWRCDPLVMEFTYGNKSHENRKHRRQRLKAIIEIAQQNQGTVIIPAFSIGRNQELLYEIEELIHQDLGVRVGGSLLAPQKTIKKQIGKT